MILDDTIVALATPSGSGAIAVIRVSGKNAIDIVSRIFVSIKQKDLTKQKTHSVLLGQIVDNDKIIDQVLVTIFKGHNSYTGENTIEISCHGSLFIQQQIIQLLNRKGCRMATPGEFTMRSFLNGKMDLSQAEAVADLISSENEASHQIAMQQMRGGFSNELSKLRKELLDFASLIELELDFAEEDVEFANRTQFKALLQKVDFVLKRLIDSFSVGNVIKNGIPVAIVGAPNVGKSTLLNALLNEDRAIVSEIAGTTRDTIEDEIVINGVGFRFIDTAGIRQTTDIVENIGIQKTYQKIDQAQILIYMFDSLQFIHSKETFIEEIETIKNKYPDKKLLIVANKQDLLSANDTNKIQLSVENIILISAKNKNAAEVVKQSLIDFVNSLDFNQNQTIVTNTRHYDSLLKTLEEIQKVQNGIAMNLSSDLLAIDINQALYYFGEITGEVTNDELLGNIFANFCIGK